MTLSNQHLFALISAAPGLAGWPLALARLVAVGLVFLVPVRLAWAWLRGDSLARRELCVLLLALGLALALALGVLVVVGLVWPQPRPATLHLGKPHPTQGDGAALPSAHVVVFWSLGLAALASRRFGLWALPLLSLGLAVGWSRVYLGVNMPYDVLAAAPVALAGAVAAHRLRHPLAPHLARLLVLYDRFAAWLGHRWSARRGGHPR